MDVSTDKTNEFMKDTVYKIAIKLRDKIRRI